LIVVTHAQFDHLGDVPAVAARTGAVVALSPTGKSLAIAAGAEPARLTAMKAGEQRRFGGVRVTAIDADHSTLFGREVYPGTLTQPPPPPQRMKGWVVGEPLAWLVELGGKRIYIESGGVEKLPPRSLGPVDLAVIGVPLKESLPRFPQALRLLHPRFVLPSHQDDFAKPLDRGFHFNIGTDMAAVRRAHAAERLPGRLILLDYYRPWVLR
jgi:L-ascorbate metabolism protein UlaG (beta-lactamase superfamily)